MLAAAPTATPRIAFPSAGAMSSAYVADAPDVAAVSGPKKSTLYVALASSTLLLYDTLLTVDKEVLYVWRAQRKWHQVCLYVLNRYVALFQSLLALWAINPVSETSCTAVVWVVSAGRVLTLLSTTTLTLLRAYALSGRSAVAGSLMLLTSIGVIAYDAVDELSVAPVNLPPPRNCTYEDAITDISSTTILAAFGFACTTLSLSLATVITWIKTRGFHSRDSDGYSHRRPSLPQVMFEYGMIYFVALLSINIADGTLRLLSITEAGQPGFTFPANFYIPISSILTTRLLLDIYKADARLHRGGVSATGSSFSLDLMDDADPTGHRGSLSALEFVASYGGPAYSLDDDDVSADTGELKGDARGVVGNVSGQDIPSVAGP
ncbi:hypothetical protein C8Q77DRAFT_1118575 [Trametes polyzona]|nr:hypothetical protein C8Q77DRAFT_1118575 [Trametes polyzona]